MIQCSCLCTDTEGGNPGGYALHSHLNSRFTTLDQDNDIFPNDNCARKTRSAWWFADCAESNLNGDFFADDFTSMKWSSLPGGARNIKYSEMKVRPTFRIRQ